MYAREGLTMKISSFELETKILSREEKKKPQSCVTHLIWITGAFLWWWIGLSLTDLPWKNSQCHAAYTGDFAVVQGRLFQFCFSQD